MSPQQTKTIVLKERFQQFLCEHINPNADLFDKEEYIPRDFFSILAREKFLGANVPQNFGGENFNYIELGLLHEIFAQGLASIENILTVNAMVCKSLTRFGTDSQKNKWLPPIIAGQTLVALALTEPHVGSDLQATQTHAIDKGNYFVLNGIKKYITLGQIADLFLVLTKIDGSYSTLLVDKATTNIKITPIRDTLSLRSNMLAEIEFDNCEIPKSQLLGKPGTGLSHVVTTALDEGRYTTACGAVGLAQACLNISRDYAKTRQQSGTTLDNHQLIMRLLTKMIVGVKTARATCHHAAKLRDEGDITHISETLVAKYYAANTAIRVADNAMQLFGGIGVTKASLIERYYRDARAMQIIEGTPQMYEINIPKNYFG